MAVSGWGWGRPGVGTCGQEEVSIAGGSCLSLAGREELAGGGSSSNSSPAALPGMSSRARPARGAARSQGGSARGGGGAAASLSEQHREETQRREREAASERAWAERHADSAAAAEEEPRLSERQERSERVRRERRAELESMREFELRQTLAAAGLPDSRDKPDMIRRLLDHEAAVADGIIAPDPARSSADLAKMKFSEVAQRASSAPADVCAPLLTADVCARRYWQSRGTKGSSRPGSTSARMRTCPSPPWSSCCRSTGEPRSAGSASAGAAAAGRPRCRTPPAGKGTAAAAAAMGAAGSRIGWRRASP